MTSTCEVIPTPSETALAFLAKRRHGSLTRAAVKLGIHRNTIYAIVAGARVSERTRRLVEDEFGASLEELQQPVEALLGPRE